MVSSFQRLQFTATWHCWLYSVPPLGHKVGEACSPPGSLEARREMRKGPRFPLRARQTPPDDLAFFHCASRPKGHTTHSGSTGCGPSFPDGGLWGDVQNPDSTNELCLAVVKMSCWHHLFLLSLLPL